MRKRLLDFWWMSGGVAQSQSDAQIRFGDDLVFAIEPNLVQTMRQEAVTSPSLTLADAEDDLVGMIQEIQYGHWLQATGAATRPKVGFGTGRNAYIKHDGTNDWMLIANSLGIFRQLWRPNPIGCFAFWIKKLADGTVMIWANSNSGTGGQTGIYIATTAANKLQFWISKHSPNVTIISYTSTTSIVVADGWVPVVCNLNGVGAGKFSMYINGTLDGTGTILAGVDQDASQLLRIGEANVGTGDFNGHWSTFLVLNRIMTADDIAWFGAYDPQVDTELHPFRDHSKYDTSEITTLFVERTSPTTNVSLEDDPVGYIQNNVPYTFGQLKRDANAPSDAKRPLYKTDPAIFFDGDTSSQELNHQVWPRGGNFLWVQVTKYAATEVPTNEGRKTRSDGAAGATTGTNYHTLTAFNDASNTPAVAGYNTVDGENYSVMHDGTSSPNIPGNVAANPGANNIEICLYWYNGNTVRAYNADGTYSQWTVTGSPYMTKIGGIAGTWTNNFIYEDNLYVGIPGGRSSKAHSAILTLISQLKTKWGVL